MNKMTEEEAERYDRQIRLWGLESQKRLRASSVLVIGLTGLGAEICKNIILAGVKSITLMDRKSLMKKDTFSQFLAPTSAVGVNRAKASVEEARLLNPLVEVKIDEEGFAKKSVEYFKSFDAIIAADCNLKSLYYLNNICRLNAIKFFCTDVFGHYGYFFTDLQNHDYTEERTILKQDKNDRLHVGKGTMQFCSLKEAFDWTLEENKFSLKTADPAIYLIRLLLNFRTKQQRNPTPKYQAEDLQLLKKLRTTTLKKLNASPTVEITDDNLSMVFSQLCPVCSIVGGLLSQEVIKALTHNGEPLNNFFLFNPKDASGKIIPLGRQPITRVMYTLKI